MKKNVKIFQNEKMKVEMKLKIFSVGELGFSPLLKITQTDDVSSIQKRNHPNFSYLESTSIKKHPVRVENLCSFGDISQ
jgi:hypothetical protein